MKNDWFEIWYQDHQAMVETMTRNMMADIDAGYNPVGACITRQRKELDEYVAKFNEQMDKLADKDEKQANRWCYMDMKKRGVIS